MKRITALFLSLIILGLSLPASAKGIEIYYDGEFHTYTGTLYELYVNGEKLTVPLEPITFNNRALVPIREVFEALGAEVEFIGETKEIMVTGNDTEVTVQIGNNTAYINGKKVAIPDGVVPKLITKVGVETKTMVPVRFISEEIGLKVEFDGKNGRILITGSAKEELPAEKITVNTPRITKEDDRTTIITVTTDEPMAADAKAAVTSAGVLYFDIADAIYKGETKTEVGHAAVTAVRCANHDEYTRVAVDMKDYKSYEVETSDDKKQITVTVVAKNGALEEKPGEEPGEKPVDKPNGGETDNPTEEEPIKVTVDIEALKKYTASNGIKYVVLDAGHGGKDSGAVGSIKEYALLQEADAEDAEDAEGEEEEEADDSEKTAEEETAAEFKAVKETKYYEKNITLAIAKLVQKELQAEGISVIMTRSADTYPTLSERSILANQNDAAMFVSIHVNAASNASKANGIEVYYAGKNNHSYYGLTSKALAGAVLDEMLDETDANSRGVKTENHLVTRTSYMPAILVEVGFISNAEEIKKLIDPVYQQKLANGISAGIISQIDKVTVPDRRDFAEKLVAAEVGAEKAKEYMDEVWK